MIFNAGKFGLAGEFRFHLHTSPLDGDIGDASEPSKNMILDGGLEWFGGTNTGNVDSNREAINLLNKLVVGTGNRPVVPNDVALESPLATSTELAVVYSNNIDMTLGRTEKTVRVTLKPGEGTGNISEVGMLTGAGVLACRALVVDSEGNPTTITKLEDEYLTVYYTIYVYWPQEDIVYQFDLATLDGPVPTTVTIRPWCVRLYFGNTPDWYVSRAYPGANSSAECRMTVATELAPITATRHPGGGPFLSLTSTQMNPGPHPYIPNSRQHRFTFSIGLQNGNSTEGISWMGWKRGLGAWQMLIQPSIKKNDTNSLLLTVGYSWGRYDV